MAVINAPSVLNIPSTAEEGNASVHFGSAVLAAAAIADKVRLCKIPAGAKVFNVKLVNAALGASTTLSVGYEPVDGSAAATPAGFAAAASTVAAGVINSTVPPIRFETPQFLTITVGGGAATGQVDVAVEYEYQGLK